MLTRHVPIAMTAVLLAGCWPVRFTERPGVAGTVVSAADGKPIAGASVRLHYLPPAIPFKEGEPAFTVVTNREGRFEADPLSYWGFNSFLGEYLPGHGSLEIDAPGFTPSQLQLSWPPTGRRTKDVGAIELMRSP